MDKIFFEIQRFTETVKGTDGHDQITVSAADRIIFGYGGNDTIYNKQYSDITIVGGNGADSIRMGEKYQPETNNLSISGGEDNDWMSGGLMQLYPATKATTKFTLIMAQLILFRAEQGATRLLILTPET